MRGDYLILNPLGVSKNLAKKLAKGAGRLASMPPKHRSKNIGMALLFSGLFVAGSCCEDKTRVIVGIVLLWLHIDLAAVILHAHCFFLSFLFPSFMFWLQWHAGYRILGFIFLMLFVCDESFLVYEINTDRNYCAIIMLKKNSWYMRPRVGYAT